MDGVLAQYDALALHAGKMLVHAAAREVQRRELAPIIKAQVERDRAELKALADEINLSRTPTRSARAGS